MCWINFETCDVISLVSGWVKSRKFDQSLVDICAVRVYKKSDICFEIGLCHKILSFEL